jgi:hypothetical protein
MPCSSSRVTLMYTMHGSSIWAAQAKGALSSQVIFLLQNNGGRSSLCKGSGHGWLLAAVAYAHVCQVNQSLTHQGAQGVVEHRWQHLVAKGTCHHACPNLLWGQGAATWGASMQQYAQVISTHQHSR